MAFLTGAPLANAGPSSQTWTTPYPHKPGDKARDKDGNEYVFCNFVTAAAGSGIAVSITPDYTAAPLLGTSLLTGRIGIAGTTVAANEGGWVQVYGLAVVQGTEGPSASTDLASLHTGGSSVSDDDAGFLWAIPQGGVTSPTGTILFLGGGDALDAVVASSLVSLSSNPQTGNFNIIYGMYFLRPGDVSALPDAYITGKWPTVTSPVSAVSGTTGVVTLTTKATSHYGGDWFMFLNYPYIMGARTS